MKVELLSNLMASLFRSQQAGAEVRRAGFLVLGSAGKALATVLALSVWAHTMLVSAQELAPAITPSSVAEVVVPTVTVATTPAVTSIAPLTAEQIDIFLDSLRAGSEYILPPIRTSQKVEPLVAGIWAGSEFSPQSDFGEIVLRFRPSVEARLARANEGQKGILADSVDVIVKRTMKGIVMQHTLALDGDERAGLVAKLSSQKLYPTRTAFVQAARDSGMYFSVPPLLSQHADNGWGLLICPRSYSFAATSRGGASTLSLLQSAYELAEVKVSVTGRASSSISTGASKERLALKVLQTENLPPTIHGSDEVVALSPYLSLTYRPEIPFDFFRFAPKSSIQEGLLVAAEMQNKAGYLKRLYFTNALYIQKLNQPSRIPIFLNGIRVATDAGSCYVLLTQKTEWSEHDKQSASF